MKKIAVLLTTIILFSACQSTNSTSISSEKIEIESVEQSSEENSDTNSKTEEGEEIIVDTYPITGLALLDFCRFSFYEGDTFLQDIVDVLGEPSGYYSENEPYFTLYDGTTIAFYLNESEYIYKPYLTDIIGRKFIHGSSSEFAENFEPFGTETIVSIKKGEYIPEIHPDPLAHSNGIETRGLSISDFASEPANLPKIGFPSGSIGSGNPKNYYQLADGSYIMDILTQKIKTNDTTRRFEIYYELTGTLITDPLGRNFLYGVPKKE